jgi:ABC-type Fe3+/spermidine/putrescine transport system ATPase subunit
MTALSVRGLTVLRARRTVLEDVSFSAAAGAITAILGNAGSGKTSLFAAIAGLLPAERGAVLSAGTDVTALSVRRRGIGLLPPGTTLPAARSAAASVAGLARRADRGEADALMAALAPGFAASAPDRLSHGQAQLALAAARLVQPGEALLIDEAGMGLDEPARIAFGAQLRHLAQAGRAIVIATRDPAIARLADHLVLLDSGRATQAGTPASLYAEPRDEAAARLTGPANILTGRIRELRGQAFVWTAGARFLQSVEPDMPRPSLGAEVTICLRPERIALLAGGETAENLLDAEITDVRAAGPLLHVTTRTALGDVLVAPPSWRPGFYPAPGQHVRLAWLPDAGWVLP